MNQTEDSFELEYECVHHRGTIDFRWRAKIIGVANGTVEWTMQGLARSAFRTNRIGLCALHPIEECA
ncbi:MAG: hypothetical protein ABI112_04780, partial [Terracoccus sp.]